MLIFWVGANSRKRDIIKSLRGYVAENDNESKKFIAIQVMKQTPHYS
jgi:hypothetical protein